MALFKPADGILRTNVSWDDLQECVFEAFGEDAKFGPNKDAKDIGFANGFMSKICLVTPDWQTNVNGIPGKFVVKVYYMREFSEQNPLKGLIIMEYLADNLSLHIFDNLTPDDILQALRTIASLEAASLKFNDDDNALFMENIFGEMFAKALTKEVSK
ncbi:hypothetical protein ANCDUO_19186 [Ancylostoma duodenale]|uniref:Uncharacterized protein n=1 Tax=Ancylostoma duodenale TaxID=51022 RepID=A0A0C2CLS2_9BILA|nr:hypothetical protein ANCDUO_19186 [Ancylostoma duodenale]